MVSSDASIPQFAPEPGHPPRVILSRLTTPAKPRRLGVRAPPTACPLPLLTATWNRIEVETRSSASRFFSDATNGPVGVLPPRVLLTAELSSTFRWRPRARSISFD